MKTSAKPQIRLAFNVSPCVVNALKKIAQDSEMCDKRYSSPIYVSTVMAPICAAELLEVAVIEALEKRYGKRKGGKLEDYLLE